jgi:hypothetical protein
MNSRLLPGERVTVRDLSEISATLDENGALDGLPFMPEMVRFCNRTFLVLQRVDKVCNSATQMGRMLDTVVFYDARCDGSAHDGCQLQCALLWKEAWLRRSEVAEPSEASRHVRESADIHFRATLDGNRFCCQATELGRAKTEDLPWWNLLQYVRDVRSGTFKLSELPSAFYGLLKGKVLWKRMALSHSRRSAIDEGQEKALNLQIGEMVEVKGRKEIFSTLDQRGTLKGLYFPMDMLEYCGRQYKVVGRIERIIQENSGRMRYLKDTVILEGGVCNRHRGCGRRLYHLWREAWLRRL